MKIIESSYLLKKEECETARSVKRRQKKPWAKRKTRVSFVPDLTIYQMGEYVMCHPVVATQIRKQLFG